MRERPILFSGPMVRAILEGRKTQTRRPVKPQPSAILRTSPFCRSGIEDAHGRELVLPYEPGDQLWVRETFQDLYAEGHEYRSADWETGKGYAISYPATDGIKEFIDPDDCITSRCRPSIHMPRWASRITLGVISMRVERLQEISEPDARTEGVILHEGRGWFDKDPADGGRWHVSARAAFQTLWVNINGQSSWNANPWVWVIDFRRVEGGAV